MPANSVYIDFVNFQKYDYDAAEWTKEWRYMAFVLTRDAEGKAVARIEDLGPAEEIDSLVARFRAVLQGRVPLPPPGSEHGTGNLRPLVLQREVVVAARLLPQIAHLALDPHIPDLDLEDVLHPPHQLRDGHARLLARILPPLFVHPHAAL